MVSPPWHNYRYHQNRPPSQGNPKFNFWEIFWAHRHFNWRMDFSAKTPVADHNISSYKTACDIHLKHVFLNEFGLWRNPGPRLHQISFRFFGYHNLARTLVILNVSLFDEYLSQGKIFEKALHYTQICQWRECLASNTNDRKTRYWFIEHCWTVNWREVSFCKLDKIRNMS